MLYNFTFRCEQMSAKVCFGFLCFFKLKLCKFWLFYISFCNSNKEYVQLYELYELLNAHLEKHKDILINFKDWCR